MSKGQSTEQPARSVSTGRRAARPAPRVFFLAFDPTKDAKGAPDPIAALARQLEVPAAAHAALAAPGDLDDSGHVTSNGGFQPYFFPDSLPYQISEIPLIGELLTAEDGEIPIGKTGSPPVLAVPGGRNGITVIPGPGSLDFEQDFESVFGANDVLLTVGATDAGFLTPGGFTSGAKAGRIINDNKLVSCLTANCGPATNGFVTLTFEVFVSIDGGASYALFVSVPAVQIGPNGRLETVVFPEAGMIAGSMHVIRVTISGPPGQSFAGSLSATLSTTTLLGP